MRLKHSWELETNIFVLPNKKFVTMCNKQITSV